MLLIRLLLCRGYVPFRVCFVFFFSFFLGAPYLNTPSLVLDSPPPSSSSPALPFPASNPTTTQTTPQVNTPTIILLTPKTDSHHPPPHLLCAHNPHRLRNPPLRRTHRRSNPIFNRFSIPHMDRYCLYVPHLLSCVGGMEIRDLHSARFTYYYVWVSKPQEE